MRSAPLPHPSPLLLLRPGGLAWCSVGTAERPTQPPGDDTVRQEFPSPVPFSARPLAPHAPENADSLFPLSDSAVSAPAAAPPRPQPYVTSSSRWLSARRHLASDSSVREGVADSMRARAWQAAVQSAGAWGGGRSY